MNTVSVPINGSTIIIDQIDLHLLEGKKWKAMPYVTHAYRDPCTGNVKREKLHNLIMQPSQGLQVDHINGDKLDNRRENLRLCTRHQNLMNRRAFKNNKCGVKGVRWYPRTKKWIAQIGIDGKLIHLGSFITMESAKIAYNEAAIKFHGAFARLNP